MSSDKDIGYLIGLMEGVAKDIEEIKTKQTNQDQAIRKLEIKAGVYGSVASAIVAFGMSVFGGGTGGPQA